MNPSDSQFSFIIFLLRMPVTPSWLSTNVITMMLSLDWTTSCKYAAKNQDHDNKLLIIIITIMIQFMDKDTHLCANNCQVTMAIMTITCDAMRHQSGFSQLIAYRYMEWILLYLILNLFSPVPCHPCILHMSAASQLLTNVESRDEICPERLVQLPWHGS